MLEKRVVIDRLLYPCGSEIPIDTDGLLNTNEGILQKYNGLIGLDEFLGTIWSNYFSRRRHRGNQLYCSDFDLAFRMVNANEWKVDFSGSTRWLGYRDRFLF